MKDPEEELKLINASYDAEYLAYQMKLGASAQSTHPLRARGLGCSPESVPGRLLVGKGSAVHGV